MLLLVIQGIQLASLLVSLYLVLRLGPESTALTMADGDGELAAFHAVEEDGGGGRAVENFHHAEAGFEGVAFVALEDGPACCVWDKACMGELG